VLNQRLFLVVVFASSEFWLSYFQSKTTLIRFFLLGLIDSK
jgi:hypothetical protein